MANYLEHEPTLLSKRLFALASASSLALTAAIGAPAYAQEAGADESGEAAPEAGADEFQDEIIVTGFRAALNTAQDVKRDSDTFVDVISAEDIGALADRSVAEALQRVPGVAIGRFNKASDPDRFSVEGSGVIIRGLSFVRAELNGRDVFSAQTSGGRGLDFNDVSPELLGSVQVFKNVTADMIEGGISGTVNLKTRKPLDGPDFRLAGTIEASIGDFAEEWSPGLSILGSKRFETDAGTFAFQLGYARSELITRTDASQVGDPCYRPADLSSGCIRASAVNDAGVVGDTEFGPDNFPPAGSVIVPKGAGIRTTEFDRDREAFSGVAQWESPDGSFVATFEYLRAETQLFLDELSILAQVNNDAFLTVPQAGTDFTYDSNGLFESGILTQNAEGGIFTELLRFQREDDAYTEDFSGSIQWEASDRLRFNFEAQTTSAERSETALLPAMQTLTDIALDLSGSTPDIQFLQPGTSDPATNLSDPNSVYYWFLIDNEVRNDGDLDTFRADAEYDIGDGFFRSARFGARWSDRRRAVRNTNFSNWGNLSAPWAGGNLFVDTFSDAASVRSPFEDHQRGSVSLPLPSGSGLFFGDDNLIEAYRDGTVDRQVYGTPDNGVIDGIYEATFTFAPWGPIYNRQGTVDGLFFDSEISDVAEETKAVYARLDFGAYDFLGDGWELEGNLGLRYVRTEVDSVGRIGFATEEFLAEIEAFCAGDLDRPDNFTGYCGLSPERQAEFDSFINGTDAERVSIDDSSKIKFSNWLPSFNAKLDVGGGLLFRVAGSRGISRPDLAAYKTGGFVGDNTPNLLRDGTLDTGPLFTIQTGNRLLTAVESWNFDLSGEWYWDDVGSLTLSLFYKDLKGLVNSGSTIRTITDPDGDSSDVLVSGPTNTDSGTIKGFELAYQDQFEFLPGPLANLGFQGTYTYVDSGGFTNASLGLQQTTFSQFVPLAGLSKHTINATVFYEDDKLSARLAYNWRSDFLITARDDQFPYSPIFQESGGQLDGSIFYAITEDIKVGVQAVNLLDSTTETTQAIDFDLTRVPRSVFRNDRRFSFLARFDF